MSPVRLCYRRTDVRPVYLATVHALSLVRESMSTTQLEDFPTILPSKLSLGSREVETEMAEQQCEHFDREHIGNGYDGPTRERVILKMLVPPSNSS